jgi:hypothetical protein
MANKKGSYGALVGLGLGVGLFAWLTSPSDAVEPNNLGSLGEIYNYTGYTPPASSAPPPSRYNTVSDDERATSGSEQPKREFSIWDSVAKPSTKASASAPRTASTHRARRPAPKQKRQAQSHRAVSINHSDSDFNSPVTDASGVGSNQASYLSAPSSRPDEEAGYSPLLIGGAALAVVLLLMSSRN